MSTTAPLPHGVAVVVTRGPGVVDEAIDKAGLSIRALEAVTGVSRSTISNVAAKPAYGIAKDKAERIADALGVEVNDLFMHRDGAPLATA
ncbi:helix-turn-helix transcriptional regulator [Nocardioides sp. STR2]|uniref:Helix-turn-helix transcriptional regulator n=1 Tax=Nocardioides pini TaxID=2975053 RepID=A0ABT4CCP3_9ACTN|nr:helix-turn-helix transcriptional regulator [Nocardioides pini]MCY4726737.1 helix-turn-helix transcriptional regulator [Nocardioides pini]